MKCMRGCVKNYTISVAAKCYGILPVIHLIPVNKISVISNQVKASVEEAGRVCRSVSTPIDWSKCFICHNKTHKKIRDMHNVCTFESCESIRQAAESKGDDEMVHVLRSVSKSNLRHQSFRENEGEGHYDTAFKEMAAEISEGIALGKAYDMVNLLSKYRELLENKGVKAESYSKQRLKLRLQKHFGDTIVFHQHSDKSKPEAIYSSHLSVQDVLNAAAQNSNPKPEDDRDNGMNAQKIADVARWLRREIRKCDGISLRPLSVNDVSLESAKRVIPSGLYWLIRLLITSDESGLEVFDLPQSTCAKKEDERRVISIAQDIIHCSSHARVKVPKHIGLAMAIRHLTGSKQLVILLNRMGHCSSYDELQAVDTSIATEVLAKAENYGTVVPSNICPGAFVQLAADNNDLNEETIDGKNTTHATTMVVYQKVFGPQLPPNTVADHSQRRRSLQRSGGVYELQDCSAHGRRPAVTQYTNMIDKEWFRDQSTVLISAIRNDDSFALLRMRPSSLMQTGIEAQDEQLVPSWSGFNSILYPDLPIASNIGYCPMIEGASTEFSTVYTVLKHAQKISASLGQADSVITFDLAIYTKAKQIQVKFPDEFSDTVIRLGGFHIALNFLSLLGKKFHSSGLDDLLIESGVYAAGTTSALIKGKSYNRGVRAHKLSMEALFRLMWNSFVVWYATRETGDDERRVDESVLMSSLQACRRAIATKTGVLASVEELERETEELWSQFQVFKSEARAISKMFIFWEEYVSTVKLLLQFIKAERTGNWQLHLSCVAAIVAPHATCKEIHIVFDQYWSTSIKAAERTRRGSTSDTLEVQNKWVVYSSAKTVGDVYS